MGEARGKGRTAVNDQEFVDDEITDPEPTPTFQRDLAERLKRMVYVHRDDGRWWDEDDD
jgi:hypothetical protein